MKRSTMGGAIAGIILLISTQLNWHYFAYGNGEIYFFELLAVLFIALAVVIYAIIDFLRG